MNTIYVVDNKKINVKSEDVEKFLEKYPEAVVFGESYYKVDDKTIKVQEQDKETFLDKYNNAVPIAGMSGKSSSSTSSANVEQNLSTETDLSQNQYDALGYKSEAYLLESLKNNQETGEPVEEPDVPRIEEYFSEYEIDLIGKDDFQKSLHDYGGGDNLREKGIVEKLSQSNLPEYGFNFTSEGWGDGSFAQEITIGSSKVDENGNFIKETFKLKDPNFQDNINAFFAENASHKGDILSGIMSSTAIDSSDAGKILVDKKQANSTLDKIREAWGLEGYSDEQVLEEWDNFKAASKKDLGMSQAASRAPQIAATWENSDEYKEYINKKEIIDNSDIGFENKLLQDYNLNNRSDLDLLNSNKQSFKQSQAIKAYEQSFNPPIDTSQMYTEEGYANKDLKKILDSPEYKELYDKIVQDEDYKKEETEFVNKAFTDTRKTQRIEEKLTEIIDDMSQNTFTKSDAQNKIAEGFVNRKKLIDEKANSLVTKLEIVQGDRQSMRDEMLKIQDYLDKTDVESEIEKIKSQYDLTTQSGVDSANKDIKRFGETHRAQIDKYNFIREKGNDYLSLRESLFAEYNKLNIDNENLNIYIDAFKRNHEAGTVLGSQFTSSIVGLGMGLANVVDMAFSIPAKLIDQEYSKAYMLENPPNPEDISRANGNRWWDKANVNVDEFQKNLSNSVKKPIAYGDIKTINDFGAWSGGVVAAQIPNLVLMYATGGASLYVMGAGSAGSKWKELNEQKSLYNRTGGSYGIDHSWGTMLLNASVTGAAEALSEKITLGQMRSAKGLIGASRGAKLGFKNYIKQEVFTFDNLKYVGKDLLEEGGSEAVSQLTGNLADIMSGNKDVNIWDGVQESFASGLLISSGMKIPSMGRAMISPFQTIDNNQKIGELANEITKLTEQSGSLDISDAERTRLEGRIADLVTESNEIMEGDVRRVGVITDPHKKALINIEKQNYQARQRVQEIGADPSISQEQKQEQIDKLKSQVDMRTKTKNDILGQYEKNVTDTKYKSDMDWMSGQQKLVNEMGGVKVETEEVNGDTFADITAKDEGEKSLAQVENMAMENESTMSALQGIVNDKDSSELEKADAQDLINRANNKVNIATDILSSKSDYGVMIPVFDNKNNLVKMRVVLNKDALTEDGMFATGAHEFIHANFRNTLKGDPNAKKIMGQQIDKILESKKITFKDQDSKDEFYDKLDEYDNNNKGEEKIAIISEFVRDGRANLNDGMLQNIAGMFRRFSRAYFNTDIEFNSNKDILNFIRDYDYNIKNNRPSPAMARMMSKGANGKIFKDAKSKKVRDSESTFSKNVNRIKQKNKDWDGSFDKFTQNEDGSKKYPNRKDIDGNDIPDSGKEDFQNSDDFWPAAMEIMNSQGLKNLIMSGVASETGISSRQEMEDFTRQVLENIQDRYIGGLSKKSRDQIEAIEEQRAKGEITAKETVEAIEAIENNKDNYKKGYDPASANGSLFGWLTGRAGAFGKSIVYTAKGDIMGAYKKRGGGKTVSMNKQIGTDGGTMADILPGTEDSIMQSIDEKDMSLGQNTDAKESVNELIKIIEGLGFPKDVVDSIVLNIQEARLNLDMSPKDVKRLLDDALQFQKKDKNGKPMFNKKGEPIMITPTSEKNITPTGALFQILNAVSTEFGIDPLRIIAGQDLDGPQRASSQEYIYSKSVNEDGSFNSTLLDILSKGETRSGEATGIANTKLGQFYVKGERLLTKEGADSSLGNKHAQKKRTNVSMAEFLSAFGINPDGSKIPGKQFDGIIRQLALEVSKGVAIQQLQADAITNGTASEAIIAKLSDGKSEAVWSRNSKKRTQQNQAFRNTESMRSKVIQNTIDDARMIAEAVLNQSDLTAIEKSKIRPKLEGMIKRYSKNKPIFKGKYKVNLEAAVEDRIAEELSEKNELNLRKILRLKDSIGNEFTTIKGLQKIQASVFRGVKKLAASGKNQVDVGRMVLTQGINAFTGSGIIGDGSIIQDPSDPTKYINNPNPPKKKNKHNAFATVSHFIANMNSIANSNIKRTTLRDGTKGWIQKSNVTNFAYEVWDGNKFVPVSKNMLKENSSDGFKDVNDPKRQEQRKQESEEAREFSKFFIEQQFEADGRELTPTLGALMMNLGSGMDSPMRKSALLTTVVNNPQKIQAWHDKNAAKLEKVFGVKIPAFRYEHSISKAEINARIIDSLIENNGKILDSVWKGYEVNIMPGIWDKAQDRAGLKTRSADGTSRLLSLDTLGELTDMIVEFGPDAIVNLQEFSSTQGDINNVNNIKKQVDSLKKLIKGFNPVSRNKTELQIGVASESMRSKKIKNVKGNSVFDFDETVGISDNVVIATKDGVTKEVKSSEWPVVGETLEAEGWDFDFSDFNKVTKGKPGPLLQKMKDRITKFGAKDVFILTARGPGSQSAIHAWLKSEGVDIPLDNITGLGQSSGDAKALWMLDKFKEGYNDMYFADDAISNVEAVRFALDQLDIKSKVVQAGLKKVGKWVIDTNTKEGREIADQLKNIPTVNSSEFKKSGKFIVDVNTKEGKAIQKELKNKPDKPSESMRSKSVKKQIVEHKNVDVQFNDMMERNSGTKSGKKVSEADAKILGRKKNRFEFFIPPSAEDFKGLLYKFIGKGKQGEADMNWFKENLLDPFNEVYSKWNKHKQVISNEYKKLRKTFPDVTKSLNKIIPGTNFTVDTAVRTYLWNKAGFDIPGMDSKTKRRLLEHVDANPDLVNFSNTLGRITRTKEGYIKPEKTWTSQTIASDLNNVVNKVGRNQFMGKWIANKNLIFSPENLNKIESIHGTDFRVALEGTLHRMETGTNRVTGKNKQVNKFLDWINGSVGAVMFFNMRSALLQTISSVNFLNFEDNNIFAASKAFANQPQFWKDFSMLFNSDMLKQRRSGLQTDVSASELTKVFAEGGSKMQAITSYLLQKGFLPTQIADSLAIAMGGSTFYRNRVNKYVKEGMTQAKAENQAMLDFQAVAEETQQSSRPDFISEQQAGPMGRIILAWANTPMQMTRLTKKALSDLVNGRGSAKANISKMMYYGVVQNIIFQTLQSGLAFLLFGGEEGEEDDEDKARKERRVLNGALDGLLVGTGIYGAAVAAIKNAALEFRAQSKKGYGKQDFGKVTERLIGFSPPIGTKIRKVNNAIKTWQYNKGVGAELGLRIENPTFSIIGNLIEASTNIPIARIINKVNNLEEAITGNHKAWQRIALVSGWDKWSIGIQDEELEAAKIAAKEKRRLDKEKINNAKKEIKKKEDAIIKAEEDKKIKEENEKKGIKTVRCSGTNSSGKRCGITTETADKAWKCSNHAKFIEGSDRDNDGIKEYQCTGTTSSGKRCKNKGEYGEAKKCYAHA